MTKLSILCLSYHKRVRDFLPRITEKICSQIGNRDDVEFLCFLDNQSVSVGRKWNTLIAAASGMFITRVGDDDLVSDDYVDRLLDAIDTNPGVDCIVFDTEMYRDGVFVATVKWGTEYEYKDDLDNKLLYRPPGELIAIRKDILSKYPYPDRWRGSDWRQALPMLEDLTKQHRIDAVLYTYLNRSDNDACLSMQKKHNAKAQSRVIAGGHSVQK